MDDGDIILLLEVILHRVLNFASNAVLTAALGQVEGVLSIYRFGAFLGLSIRLRFIEADNFKTSQSYT